MRSFSASEMAKRLGAENHAEGATVLGFATDSREVQAGDLFVAIRGEHVDGHDFIPVVLGKGAAATLVERPVEGPHFLVSNVVEALARFGRSLRDEFKGPVVGLTGSAGKTTTKEMLARTLAPLGSVVKTPGNRNTEYTSPLLWADVDARTRVVVIEMAMRGFGQIAHLARVAQPTVGVVTNVGYSHLLQVGSREGIARAKGELLEALPSDGTCVLPSEDDFFPTLQERAGSRSIFTFGFDEAADCRIDQYTVMSQGMASIEGSCRGERWRSEIPAGRHLALDAAAAVLTAHVLGVPAAEAADELRRLVLPPMRMETRELNGATILLDAYNAAPPSVLAAIETLLETPVAGRRLAVLGEMRELGDATEEAHRRVGVAASRLDDAIFVGGTASLMQEAAGKGTTGDLDAVRRFLSGVEPGDVVLIKGSRALELERVLERADV